MKRLVITIGIALLAAPVAFAAGSGACSGHDGVDCLAGPDIDGSVLCMDGWTDSSVFYSEIKEVCGDDYVEPIFSDVGQKTAYADAIEFVKSEGIVEGYSDGFYKPLNNINRAEFVKILIEFQFPEEIAAASGSACFNDVQGTEWYAKYVCFAKTEGIIGGYPDGTFQAGNDVNVAEALKIVLETVYGSVPDVEGEWYQKYVTYAEGKGLMLGWKDVSELLTRGEMAELIYRAK